MLTRYVTFLACLGLMWFAPSIDANAQFKKTVFHRAAHKTIKSIDILESFQQQKLVVLDRSVMALQSSQSSGNTPQKAANVQAAQETLLSNSQKLSDGLKARNFSLDAKLTEQIAAALESRGYAVSTVKGQRPRQDGLDYSNIKSNADAVLYAVIRFCGYKQADQSKELTPLMGVDVSLYSNAEKKIVYRQVFDQDFQLIKDSEVETVKPLKKVSFSSAKSAVSAPEEAMAGLQAVSQAIADHVASQLAQQ